MKEPRLVWDIIDAMYNEESPFPQKVKSILTRDFVLCFFALFSFLVASHFLTPTLPIYLAKLGSNDGEIGVIVGILGVASLISRFFVGNALHKYREKSVMIFGALLFALTFLACIVFRPFWPLFLVRLLQGVAFASLDTAAIACIVKILPPAYRGHGLGYFLMAPTLALALAPSLGIFLINRYSFTILFLASTSLSLCAFIFAYKLKKQEIITTDKYAPAAGVFFLDLKIIVPATAVFLQMFVFGALAAFFPLYAIQCGVINPGHFFSAIAVMLIIARTLGGKFLDIYSKEKIILTCMVISIAAMVMLYFSRTLPMFIFVGLLWGLGGAFFYPALMAYAFDYAGSSGGTAVGTYQALMDLGLAIGPMIMGIITGLIGYRAMFLCLVLVCFVNLCYFQFCVRNRSTVTPMN